MLQGSEQAIQPFGLRPESIVHNGLLPSIARIDAPTWFKVAHWGTKSKAINWKVAAIAKTVGEYAIGGWERSPSAKQAKWAMEAYKTAQSAGALSNSPGAS